MGRKVRSVCQEFGNHQVCLRRCQSANATHYSELRAPPAAPVAPATIVGTGALLVAPLSTPLPPGPIHTSANAPTQSPGLQQDGPTTVNEPPRRTTRNSRYIFARNTVGPFDMDAIGPYVHPDRVNLIRVKFERSDNEN